MTRLPQLPAPVPRARQRCEKVALCKASRNELGLLTCGGKLGTAQIAALQLGLRPRLDDGCRACADWREVSEALADVLSANPHVAKVLVIALSWELSRRVEAAMIHWRGEYPWLQWGVLARSPDDAWMLVGVRHRTRKMLARCFMTQIRKIRVASEAISLLSTGLSGLLKKQAMSGNKHSDCATRLSQLGANASAANSSSATPSKCCRTHSWSHV
eukprot:4314188-Amphidinium_carterae.1